jgi:hypothetical protein
VASLSRSRRLRRWPHRYHRRLGRHRWPEAPNVSVAASALALSEGRRLPQKATFSEREGILTNSRCSRCWQLYTTGQGPKKTDPTTYLAGGNNFFTALPFNVQGGTNYGTYLGPNIISRNLTPDKNGLPEGGHTLTQFMTIMRTGVDLDKIHPTCTQFSPTIEPANCIPPPVDGSRLQVMPWPDFQDATDHDLEAIWTYLSVIPRIDNKTSTPPAGAPNELCNNCGN